MGADWENMAESDDNDDDIFFKCKICAKQYKGWLSYELHINSLLHKQHQKTSREKGIEIEAHLYQDFSEAEFYLLSLEKPIIGLDYLTDYIHLNGCFELVCNLCRLVFLSIKKVTAHMVTKEHILNYMAFNCPATYKEVKNENEGSDFILRKAKDIEDNFKERSKRIRVMKEVENSLTNSWTETSTNMNIKPISDLEGHQLNFNYSKLQPHTKIPINDISSLLTETSFLYQLASGLPPSLHSQNLSKLEFLNNFITFQLLTEEEANIFSHVSNYLVKDFIEYRLKCLSNFQTIDISKVRTKLLALQCEASLLGNGSDDFDADV